MKERTKCVKCGYEYNNCSIRVCPYSKQGLHVCVYCCKKCKFVTYVGTGFGCSYKKEQKDKTKEE